MHLHSELRSRIINNTLLKLRTPIWGTDGLSLLGKAVGAGLLYINNNLVLWFLNECFFPIESVMELKEWIDYFVYILVYESLVYILVYEYFLLCFGSRLRFVEILINAWIPRKPGGFRTSVITVLGYREVSVSIRYWSDALIIVFVNSRHFQSVSFHQPQYFYQS